MEDKVLRGKCLRIVQDHGDVLQYILESETAEINNINLKGDTEFDVIKKVYENEGLKEGMRRIIRKINHYASKLNSE